MILILTNTNLRLIQLYHSFTGPGFTAALTATTPEGGQGDSHRGGVCVVYLFVCVDMSMYVCVV